MQTDWVFPPFRIDVRGELVWRETQQVELRPKTFALLRYLVEHAGQLVTKDELLNAVWPGTVVGEAVLKVSIRELRNALGDMSGKPRFIETVHRRGYRFLPAVASQSVVSRQDEERQESQSKRQEITRDTFSPVPSPSYPAPLLVGRDTMLMQLHSLLTKAEHGEKQLVFVSGDAGIGKTALIDTFLSQVAADATVWSVRGQCFEHYGSQEAYLPILEVISGLCRRPERERIITLLQQYAPTWLMQLPGVLSGTEREALQRRLLGSSQDRMLREMADFLDVLSTQVSLIFVLEDLHWSDTSTLDLVAVLARRTMSGRLLMVGTYRPVELILNRHPLKQVKQELQSHNQCAEVTLELLSPGDVEQFVIKRFARDQQPLSFGPELAAFVYQRTDGHPLFMTALVDEVVDRYQSQGQFDEDALQATIASLDQTVPANIRHLIEQQKEQLREEEQVLLEAASVVGIEFSTAAVAAALAKEQEWVEEQCELFVHRQQFLRSLGVIEWPDGTIAGRYAFLHALHQNVMYDSISPVRRLRLHQRIGEREEAAYGTRSEEIATVLAHHFENAQEYRRAVRYLQLSATTAKGRAAPREAIVALTKALQLLQTWLEGAERLGQELSLQLALGPVLMATRGYASVEVERAFARARELCQQLGNPPLLFPAIWGVWASHVVRGQIHAARELAEQCFALAQQTQDPDQLVEAHHALWVTKFFAGEFVDVLSHIEQGLTFYRPAHQEFIRLYGKDAATAGLSYRAVALCLRGYHDQAIQASTQALAQAHDVAHLFSVGFAMQFTSWTYFLRNDYTALREHADAQITFSTEQGFPFWQAGGVHFRARALAAQGQTEEGLTLMRQGLAAWQATGAKLGMPSYLATFAELCARTDRWEEAFSTLAQAFAFMEQTGQRYYEAELYRIRGELLLQQESQNAKVKTQKSKRRAGDWELGSGPLSPQPPSPTSQFLDPSSQGEAEACFLKALDIARQQHARSLELRAVMSLIRLRQRQQINHATPTTQHEAQVRLDDDHRMLSDIYCWFTEGFDTADLQEAKTLLTEWASDEETGSAEQNQRLTKRFKQKPHPSGKL